MSPPGPTYGGYLDLDRLLGAQHPLSDPPHPDELLFIIQHQTAELWFKLLLHELSRAASLLAADDDRRALKASARAKQVMLQLTNQWSVLATLTPDEYAGFRGTLGTSSGFQSWQYRAVEALLGARDGRYLDIFADEPVAVATLGSVMAAPSLYDAFWGWMARRGHPVPERVLGRDLGRGWQPDDDLVDVAAALYADPAADWPAYEACEELLDLDDAVALWRFHHLTTVARIIGDLPGTGGSSGTAYLRSRLGRCFFPELHAVRSRIVGAAS